MKGIGLITNQPEVYAVYITAHARYQLGVLYKAAEFMAERSGDFKRAAYLGNRYISFMGSVPDVTEQRQRDRAGLGLRLQSKED